MNEQLGVLRLEMEARTFWMAVETTCEPMLFPSIGFRSDPPQGEERGGSLWRGTAALRHRCGLHPEGRHVRPNACLDLSTVNGS